MDSERPSSPGSAVFAELAQELVPAALRHWLSLLHSQTAWFGVSREPWKSCLWKERSGKIRPQERKPWRKGGCTVNSAYGPRGAGWSLQAPGGAGQLGVRMSLICFPNCTELPQGKKGAGRVKAWLCALQQEAQSIISPLTSSQGSRRRPKLFPPGIIMGPTFPSPNSAYLMFCQ